jgi:hypothetical protein
MTKINHSAAQVITKRYCVIMISGIPLDLFDCPHFISWIDTGNSLPQNAYLWKLVDIPDATMVLKDSSRGYTEAAAAEGSISFELRFDKEDKQGICCYFHMKLFKKSGNSIEEIGSSQVLIQLLSPKATNAKNLVAYFSPMNERDSLYSPMPPSIAGDEEDLLGN